MASIRKLDERRYKITVSNGYRPNGKKISKAKTIQVPPGVPKRGIGQYVCLLYTSQGLPALAAKGFAHRHPVRTPAREWRPIPPR